MIILFIDTSISIPTISLVKNNEIIYEFHEKIGNDMSSKILPIIDDALIKNNLSINNIDKVFVVNGPGSFTGVRIGVTIAKTIAWALKIPVIPVSSLEFISTTETIKDYNVPMIDARRGNVFAGLYDKKLNNVKHDSLINIVDLKNDMNNKDVEFLSYDNLEGVLEPKPNVIKIIEKHMNDNGVLAHNLKPNYLKLTEAEENRLKND